MKNAFFLNNLEQWMDAVICQDGLTDSEIILKVKMSFRTAMQANIDYHEGFANTEIRGNHRRHNVLAQIYKELLS
jgi:hypothetical protein